MKKQKGITLVALIITIIVLLILAVVAISAVSGDGIIEHAKTATQEYKEKADEEGVILQNHLNYIDNKLEEDDDSNDPEPAKQYTVTFYDENKITVLATVTVEEGQTAIYPNAVPTKAETDSYVYTFSHWTTENGTNEVSLTNIKENLSVYAYYTEQSKPEYTVTFYDDDKSTVLATVIVKEGQTATYPNAEPTKAQTSNYKYTFSHWTTEDGTRIESFANITANLNVYAYYTEELVCFVAGTKVLTETGLINIEDVTVGMKVYSMNEATGKTELKEVLKTFKNPAPKNMCKVYVNGEIIESTSNHAYYVIGKGWLGASKLNAGDILLNAKGEQVVVQQVEVIDNKNVIDVYNFTVEDNHNYYVGQSLVLVHNVIVHGGSAC